MTRVIISLCMNSLPALIPSSGFICVEFCIRNFIIFLKRAWNPTHCVEVSHQRGKRQGLVSVLLIATWAQCCCHNSPACSFIASGHYRLHFVLSNPIQQITTEWHRILEPVWTLHSLNIFFVFVLFFIVVIIVFVPKRGTVPRRLN